MFRRKSTKKKRNDYIKWRGTEVTRIEAFSDAVFAFAVTLLIVSLEVPHTFEEMIASLKLFLPFGICFLIVFTIWNRQNIFFRRYGMHDVITVTLNGMLLFLVLAYMFPLKFLFSAIFQRIRFTEPGQFSLLFGLYCGGFASFYFLFGLMYLNAYKRRQEIKLNGIEAFQTMSHAHINFIIAGISTVAVLVAAISDQAAVFAGCTFWFLWPVTAVYEKRRKQLLVSNFGELPDSTVKQHMHAHNVPNDELN